ncbi:MAG: SMI1/KNR4 family protein [Deferribacteraceae bacterium]|jgi:cell wall assembly regulator SMI1|nr:SMI1/KNR4 family protein [Deferribacteraceae bacterium]
MLVDSYLKGFFVAMAKCEYAMAKDNLAALKMAGGASDADIARLKQAYPDCPQALIELLKRIDGSYFREYNGHEVWAPLMGDGVALLSVEQIIENKAETRSIAAVYHLHDAGHAELQPWQVDDRINIDTPIGWRLHFTDSDNDGFCIDFDPCTNGVKGQILDNEFILLDKKIRVVANNFEEYLQNLIDSNYAFINKCYFDIMEGELHEI